ncbi:MAG: transglycosylase SLT domain-containing protein [Acidobacteriaceae bacterium]
MAQELMVDPTPAAIVGVQHYATTHHGEAAASAELAVGHALMMDHRFAEAQDAFHKAGLDGSALQDYAEYLEAQAAIAADHAQTAIPLLTRFAVRHPNSIFDDQAPILLSQAYLDTNDPAGALAVLRPLAAGRLGSLVAFRLALAKTYQVAGSLQKAADLYRGIYLGDPLSSQAIDASSQMALMNASFSAAERKQHADALFNARRYQQARDEYRELQRTGKDLTPADRDALDIYIAVCDLRLGRLTRAAVERLPVTGDDSAALKLYLQSELARNQGDTDQQNVLVRQLEAQYPHSRWLEEALYSGGNMFLLHQQDLEAIQDDLALVQRFPNSIYAPRAQWQAAWLSYRLRRYNDAERLMEDQITHYPGSPQTPQALYWRARLYEQVEHNPGQALNFYRKLRSRYVSSYDSLLAGQRIEQLTATGEPPRIAPAPALAYVPSIHDPELTGELPENDPHLIKARLLANAALNEYIRPEIQLSPTSAQWGALAEAEIYASFGQSDRALRALKRSNIPFFSLPLQDVPLIYWQLLLPRPYWQALKSDALAQGLDPYLVAALIRQESEFNPAAISPMRAYGLMQLLPSVGRSLARNDGQRRFRTSELLDPLVNLRLGTQDLRRSINEYGGQVEYALAAYDAGDTPVRRWIALGGYQDIAEWVESIPYSETRNYVEAILRNRALYRQVYGAPTQALSAAQPVSRAQPVSATEPAIP